MVDGAGKIFCELVDFLRVSIDRIQVGLEIAVGAGDVAFFEGEEEVAAVIGPAEFYFDGLIVGKLVNGVCGSWIRAGS